MVCPYGGQPILPTPRGIIHYGVAIAASPLSVLVVTFLQIWAHALLCSRGGKIFPRRENSMQRPIGTFIAGVILLVSGLFGLVIFTMGLLGTAAMPPSARNLTLSAESIFAVVCIFCLWVAIGLFRMRAWARYVSIVLAAVGACFCAFSGIMMLLLDRMPLAAANLPPEVQHSVFTFLAVIYFVLAGIAIFWVIYFNRASIRTAFAAAAFRRQGEDAFGGVILPNRRQHDVVTFPQIVLWVVAVPFLIGGASMIFLMFLGTPMFLLGWLATGTPALVIEFLWTCLLVYAGLGLIFHWRGGWFLAVFLQLYSLLSVILLLIPAYTSRLIAASQILAAHLAPGSANGPVNASFMVASSAVGGLLALGILVALVKCRQSYLS